MEDVVEDAELAIYRIKQEGIDHLHVRVDNLEDFRKELIDFQPNVILSDYSLPTCTAIDAFEFVTDNIPFIILSGAIGEEKAVEALRNGVTDYVSKNSLSRLSHVLERAIMEQAIRREKLETEKQLAVNKERLELALTGAELGTWDWDLKTNKIIFNKRATDIFNISVDVGVEFELKSLYQIIHPESRIQGIKAIRAHSVGDSRFFECELRVKGKEDQWKWTSAKGQIIRASGGEDILRASGTLQDIDRAKTQQEKLVRSQRLLHEAQEIAGIGSFEWTLSDGFTYCSRAFRDIYEVEERDLINHRDFYFNHVHSDDREYVLAVFLKDRSGKQDIDLEHRIEVRSENQKIIRSRGQLFFDDNGHIVRVVGTVLDVTEQKETQRALYRGQELERQRVAREIHDGIGQMLIATKYKVAAVCDSDGEPVSKSIEEVEDFLDNIIEETRRISRNLSNRMLEEFGIVGALKFLVKELSTISKVNIEGKIENITNLSGEVSVAIYRIVQEAINNAIKHSGASTIEVSLNKNKMTLLLKIKDNGKGFDTDGLRKSRGSGLKNMEERASSLNGHFEIISRMDQGTEITTWLPLSL